MNTRVWLVTGGCGFLGRRLISKLLEDDGVCVRVVDDLSVGKLKELSSLVPVAVHDPLADLPEPQSGKVQFFQGDVRDAELALRVAAGCDVIVHFAANTGVAPSVENPRMDCDVNVLGTLNYLEAARSAGGLRFVFASSGAPVGECTPPIHEEFPVHPVSPYGASKLAGEGYCSAYFRTFGVPTVALRFSNVYGPLSAAKSSVVAQFMRAGLAGRALSVYGDGSQTRDFIYVDDLIRAVIRAATTPDIGGEIFQIATGREFSVNEMVRKVGEAFASRGLDVPETVHAASRLGDVKRNFSNTDKAERVLGWQAKVGLEEGLALTLDWFLENQGTGPDA